jgi:hypothetical protein
MAASLYIEVSAGGDTTTSFTIGVGGGLVPDSLSLVGGGSQTYTDVPVGEYSVTPVIPDGWELLRIVTSNDSPSEAITVSEDEPVTVFIVFSELEVLTLPQIGNPLWNLYLFGLKNRNEDTA